MQRRFGQSISKKKQNEPYKIIIQNGERMALDLRTVGNCRGTQELRTLPSFHVANIQNILPKTVRGSKGLFVKDIEKICFLREQCKEEKPYFMAFAETHLKEEIKEVEFEMEGYSHVTSHRKNRIGGGVIIYISNDLTYQTLASNSDEMCSMVAVYINELKSNCIHGL